MGLVLSFLYQKPRRKWEWKLDHIIQVLIIEDDFRVAEINRQFVNQVEGFQVIYIAKTGDEALSYLENSSALPELILLDVYMPDREGLSLFWEIRKNHYEIDIIMVTAAKEVTTIQETLRGGVFDYIVKPMDFVRLERTLKEYNNQRRLFASRTELEQEEIDQLTGLEKEAGLKNSTDSKFPKGIDHLTLDKIRNVLHSGDEQGITALQMGEAVGVSRSTSRRYLEYLVSLNEAEAQLKYGEIGRPERRYTSWTK